MFYLTLLKVYLVVCNLHILLNVKHGVASENRIVNKVVFSSRYEEEMNDKTIPIFLFFFFFFFFNFTAVPSRHAC